MVVRECKTHGLSEYIKEKTGYFRCKKCRVEAVSRRRKKLKQMAVDYKGGKCVLCSYNKCNDALEFHHKDDSSKEFGISAKGYTRAFEVIKKELDKCILVCSNCHKELHSI